MSAGGALAPDAELVLAIASTAMPFARSPQEQSERWLRVLRLHGEVGIAMQALGVSEVSLTPARESVVADDTAGFQDGDAVAQVTREAVAIADRRGSTGVTTVELLMAVMRVYGEHFGDVLEAHGADCDEVLDRLGVVAFR
jgi:hypothetical protein